MMIKKSVLKDIINDHKKCLFADFVLDFFLISLYIFFFFSLVSPGHTRSEVKYSRQSSGVCTNIYFHKNNTKHNNIKKDKFIELFIFSYILFSHPSE